MASLAETSPSETYSKSTGTLIAEQYVRSFKKGFETQNFPEVKNREDVWVKIASPIGSADFCCRIPHSTSVRDLFPILSHCTGNIEIPADTHLFMEVTMGRWDYATKKGKKKKKKKRPGFHSYITKAFDFYSRLFETNSFVPDRKIFVLVFNGADHVSVGQALLAQHKKRPIFDKVTSVFCPEDSIFVWEVTVERKRIQHALEELRKERKELEEMRKETKELEELRKEIKELEEEIQELEEETVW